MGTLGSVVGATVDRTYPEPVAALTVTLTLAGRHDPLFADLPDVFDAYGGHKEAATSLPSQAVCLASSASCPVQAFRVGNNAYATQFHPELDADGICTRIDVYKNHGYFAPEAAEPMKAAARQRNIKYPPDNPAEVRRAVHATNVSEFEKGGPDEAVDEPRTNSSTRRSRTPVEVGPVIDVRDQDCPGGFVDTDQAIPQKVLYGTVGYGTVG